MYELVIYEDGRIKVLARADAEAELRRMWGTARHAVIAQAGAVVTVKPGTATQALAELRTAVRLGVDGPAPPLANPLRGVPTMRDRAPVQEVEEEPEEGDEDEPSDEGEEPEEEEELDEEGDDEPAPAPAPARTRRTPAPKASAAAGCARPGCQRARPGPHNARSTRAVNPVIEPLCMSCRASGYRLARHGRTLPDAVAYLMATPVGSTAPGRPRGTRQPAPEPAPVAPKPAPKPSTLPAPTPTPAATRASKPAPMAGDLGALLGEAQAALALCRRYGGVDAVRAVMEQLDAWRREAA